MKREKERENTHTVLTDCVNVTLVVKIITRHIQLEYRSIKTNSPPDYIKRRSRYNRNEIIITNKINYNRMYAQIHIAWNIINIDNKLPISKLFMRMINHLLHF